MSNPPLSLEQLLYDDIHVEARRDHVPPSDGAPIDAKLQVDVRAAHLKESADKWNVIVTLSVDRNEDGPIPPYLIRLRCWSVFQVLREPDVAEDEVARMAIVTGGSIVYSAAREYLAMLTSRGPWGPYQLPTISLAGEPVETAPGQTAAPENPAPGVEE